MFKLIFFVPIDHSERVKKALFEAGAGRLGNYSHCSFESEGIGQFLPLQGSNPAIGKVGEVERVPELKVEMLCSVKNLGHALKALKDTHPYEEPAFEVYKIEDVSMYWS